MEIQEQSKVLDLTRGFAGDKATVPAFGDLEEASYSGYSGPWLSPL